LFNQELFKIGTKVANQLYDRAVATALYENQPKSRSAVPVKVISTNFPRINSSTLFQTESIIQKLLEVIC